MHSHFEQEPHDQIVNVVRRDGSIATIVAHTDDSLFGPRCVDAAWEAMEYYPGPAVDAIYSYLMEDLPFADLSIEATLETPTRGPLVVFFEDKGSVCFYATSDMGADPVWEGEPHAPSPQYDRMVSFAWSEAWRAHFDAMSDGMDDEIPF